MIASILNNHQNNCKITRVTSVLYRLLKTKKLGQHFHKEDKTPAAFPQLPPLGGSKVLLLIPLPNQDKISKFE